MLLASCNQANPSTDISNNSAEPSVSELAESSKTEEASETSSAEPDYQTEMTEEMARAYLKYRKTSASLEEVMVNHEGGSYDYKDDYIAFGNLNGYTLCAVLHGFTYGFVPTVAWDRVVGDYVFLSRTTGDILDFCLYKDNEFVSLNDAYEKNLFDAKEAYELVRKNDKYKDCAKKSSEVDYPVKMSEEMANAYLKFMGCDSTIKDYVVKSHFGEEYDYTQDFIAYGKMKNGYTLCMPVGIFAGISTDASMHYTVGDYVFLLTFISNPSRVGLYLYKDNTFMTFEDADKQGLIDADEVYNFLQASGINPMVKLSDLPADKAEYYRQNPIG